MSSFVVTEKLAAVGVSFTGVTVIETVSVVEVSAASQDAEGLQLSGSPRSVTL